MPEEGPAGARDTMASECELRLRGRPSGGNRWRARGKAETGQESLDDLLLGDHRKDLTPSLAARTFQDIEFEHTHHQVRPGTIPSPQRHKPVAACPLVSGLLDAQSCRGCRLSFALRTISNDASPPLGARRKNSVVADTMPTRCGYEHSELFYEFELSKGHVRGSVSPRVAKLVRDAAVIQLAEALRGHRTSRDIAGQSL